MADHLQEDALFGQLDRLVAMAKTFPRRDQRQDRRLLLSLQCDLNSLRTALTSRKDAVAQKLSNAGAGNRAMNAYSRTASLARSATAPITK